MRTSNRSLRRFGFSALLAGSLASTALAQEPAAPAQGGTPAPGATAPSTPAPAPAAVSPQAAPAVTPAHADILYASDAGIIDTFSGGDGSCGEGCGTCQVDCCQPCCAPLFWGSVEALGWWQKGTDVPALVTTSVPGTTEADAGVLGLTTTTVLVGEQFLPYDVVPGGRFTIGHWLDASQEHSIRARYWLLSSSTYDNTQVSDGSTILAIPFVDLNQGVEAANLIAFPNAAAGIFSGNTNVHSVSNFNGGDVLLGTPIYRDCSRRLDLIAGYTFSRQSETLSISSTSSTQTVAGGPFTETITTLDQFATSNEFHGGTLGLSMQRQVACLSVDLLAKVAFGDMRQTTFINGSTTTTNGAGIAVENNGIFAQSTNIGQLVDNRFCVVPEVNLNFGFFVCPCLKLYAGYSFIYWSSVARPGAQIDPVINLAAQGPIPVGDLRPAHTTILSNNTWLQGVNAGLEYRF